MRGAAKNLPFSFQLGKTGNLQFHSIHANPVCSCFLSPFLITLVIFFSAAFAKTGEQNKNHETFCNPSLLSRTEPVNARFKETKAN